MRKRPFGRTGLEISELVFGGGYVGGILVHQDDDTRRTAVRRAIDAGINWIDTAASYGQGQSETAIGWLLKELDADDRPYISTKFHVDPKSQQGDIASQIERSLEQSLTRLQLDHVELYQLHNLVGAGDGELPVDAVLGPGGVCDVMERLRSRGVIGQIGFTALGDPAACQEVIRSGRVASAQVYYNLLNPSAGHAVPANWSTGDFRGMIDVCADNGVAVMNIRTFAGGVVASPKPHGREWPITPNSEFEREAARVEKAFAALGEGYGTRAQVALRFGLANAKISGVVFGLAELAHLDEALAAAELGPLPDDAIERLKPLWADNFGE